MKIIAIAFSALLLLLPLGCSSSQSQSTAAVEVDLDTAESSARHPQERDFSTSHVGFRVVYDVMPSSSTGGD